MLDNKNQQMLENQGVAIQSSTEQEYYEVKEDNTISWFIGISVSFTSSYLSSNYYMSYRAGLKSNSDTNFGAEILLILYNAVSSIIISQLTNLGFSQACFFHIVGTSTTLFKDIIVTSITQFFNEEVDDITKITSKNILHTTDDENPTSVIIGDNDELIKATVTNDILDNEWQVL